MAETTGLLNRRTGHSVPRVRISSSPQPFWDHAAGCASSWLFLLSGPGGSLLTSGAGRRKQTRGPKDRRLHDPKGVARTPAGGPEMPQAQRRGISSSPHESGSQVSGSPFLCNFVAPLSHRMASQTLFLPVFTLLAEHQEHKPIDNKSYHHSSHKNPG